MHASDIRLCVLSLSELRNTLPTIDLADAAPEYIRPLLSAENSCILLNKSDLGNHAIPETVTFAGSPLPFWVVSLTEGTGTKSFLDGLQRHLKHRYDLGESRDIEADPRFRYALGNSSASTPLITRERHRVHFVEALQFLQAFLDTRKSPPASRFATHLRRVAREEPVIAAEELRYAAQAIARVTGRIDVENVLDVVFREFCIGK